MSDKGKSIIDAVKYLDAFYSDVGSLFTNFERSLADRGFLSHPSGGNKTTYTYAVTNHIERSSTWTLKNIQRLYLKEDEIEAKSKAINRALISSLALYPSSAFEFPVLICGVLRWDGSYDLDAIFASWPTSEICEAIKNKNSWRLKNRTETDKKSRIYRLMPLNKLKNINEYSIFIVDLVKVENSKLLQEVVTAMVDLYDESDEIIVDPDLVVDTIPEKLMATWLKPVTERSEE